MLELNRVEGNGCRNFLKKVQSSFVVLYFYVSFQVYEIVNSDSEIIYSNPQPRHNNSFIVKLAVSLGSTSDLCPHHQKCLVEEI